MPVRHETSGRYFEKPKYNWASCSRLAPVTGNLANCLDGMIDVGGSVEEARTDAYPAGRKGSERFVSLRRTVHAHAHSNAKFTAQTVPDFGRVQTGNGEEHD